MPKPNQHWYAKGWDTARRGFNSTWSPRELAIGSAEWEAWHRGHAACLQAHRRKQCEEIIAGQQLRLRRKSNIARP